MSEGFALRHNGTCLAGQTFCNSTVAPFYACCPQYTYCSNEYNQVCCDSPSNCTANAVRQPKCADASWTLYKNGDVDSGYFCCLNSTTGYAATASGSDGCGDPGYVLGAGEVRLKPLSQSGASSTNSSAISAQRPSNTISGGTIAGIVIGSIAALLLLIALLLWAMRRHRRAQTTPSTLGKSTSSWSRNNRMDDVKDPYFIESKNRVEADSQAIVEMPCNSTTKIVRNVYEMDGMGQR